MTRPFVIQTRLSLSKLFASGSDGFDCGRYRVRAIPSALPGKSEAVLEFIDAFEGEIGGGSHPEEEANILCDFLSLILEARVKRDGFRINSIDIVQPSGGPPEFAQGSLDVTSLQPDFEKVLSLKEGLGRQFGRACRSYASALDFIPSDPTFAFFLLVVATECMSSQACVISAAELPIDSKKCDRFCTFIERFLPDEFKGDDERDPGLLRELLKEAYFAHRSAFVHGGKEVSSASLMADRAGSSFFKHATDGKEVKTPGLRWFARIVRGALLGYLRLLPDVAGHNNDLLARLAREKALLRVKARKAISAGQIATFDDVDYR